MNIGIVLHPYNEERPSGLGRAVFEITKAIVEGDIEGNEYTVFIKGHHSKHPQFDGKYTVKELPEGFLWLDRGLAQNKLGTVLFPTTLTPLFVKVQNPVIVVHDLDIVHRENPTFKDRLARFMFVRSIKKAQHIVTVSEATRQDVHRTLGIPLERMTVVYNGTTNVCVREPEVVEGAEKPFFLFVGVVKRRKNVLNIMKAFAQFKKQGGKQHLVIAGKAGSGEYYDAVVNVIEENHLENQVHFVGFVNDPQLSFLFQETDALIYPTLLEGFGMTILEGMVCGAPVLTSDLPPQREAGGEAVLYADPENPTSIAEGLQKLTDPELRKKLREKGYTQADSFSWKETGKGYRTVLDKTHERTK